MDNYEIKIPSFEGYDKGPRWEQDGLFQFVAFEDGATFGYVTYIPGEGWVSRCLCMADDGTDLVDSGFFTAGQAMEYVNKVYAEWQEHLANLELDLDLDLDEVLLDMMDGMDPIEMLVFLELLDED
jgi:hypothetical protein